MYCLSIDTTAKTASACISEYSGGLLLPICETNLNGTLTHSETLLPMIDNIFRMSGRSIDDIGVIALSAGPGSFTGVRIGASAAKGLSFSLKSKGIKHVCVPVSSLESLANNICVPLESGVVICPVMDARRSQVYNALFTAEGGNILTRLCPDRLITAADLHNELCGMSGVSKVILVGDGVFVAKKVFDASEKRFDYEIAGGGFVYQHAFSVAKTAFDYIDKWENNREKYNGAALSPIYLRASQAEREREEKLKNSGCK